MSCSCQPWPDTSGSRRHSYGVTQVSIRWPLCEDYNAVCLTAAQHSLIHTCVAIEPHACLSPCLAAAQAQHLPATQRSQQHWPAMPQLSSSPASPACVSSAAPGQMTDWWASLPGIGCGGTYGSACGGGKQGDDATAKVGSACAGCMARAAHAHDRMRHGAVCVGMPGATATPWHLHWHDVTFGTHSCLKLPMRVLLLGLFLSL